jgi:hypothetical protein
MIRASPSSPRKMSELEVVSKKTLDWGKKRGQY